MTSLPNGIAGDMPNDHETNTERVWEIVEKTGICMMTTRFNGGLLWRERHEF
jgi:hypothetical protein